MRIIYFHQYFTTPEGAAGTRSYEMAKALMKRGHNVVIVCGSAGRGVTGISTPFHRGIRRGVYEGIEIVELDLSYSNSDGLLRRTAAFARFAVRGALLALTERYDVIFATTTPLTAGIPGILGRWLRGKPFVFEVRDLWPELPRAMGVVSNPFVLKAMAALEWASYRSANFLIALAPGIVTGISRCGVPESRIALIPNGCDVSLLTSTSPWRPPGVGEDELLAVFCGAHGIANGLDAVLDAAAALRATPSARVRIVLVGEGKLKQRLQERARAEGLDNVLFMAPMSKRKLAGLLSASDVGLQVLANVPAFYYGTSPNKFFDYLACGLPVLINYPGWLADVVHESACGYAVPPSDPVAFANALIDAASRRADLDDMGVRSRRLAEGQFNRSVLASRFADAIERVACP